jgi:hypothetical protein
MKRILFIVVAAAQWVWPAWAWNHTGHKVVAELAWRNLSPGKRKAASELLKQHPHYALLLATNVPAGMEVNEWAFLNGAVWPDMVRPARGENQEKPSEITKYHRSPWHYINIPFVPPAEAATVSASSFSIPPTNIIWAISNALVTLNDPRVPAPDRAVSLCWVLHLVGDLHQPLHAATLLSAKYPRGDMGGNSQAIADASQIPLNLHSFWDQMLGNSDTPEGITVLSDAIEKAPQYEPKNLEEYKRNKTVPSWANESFLAAATFAYEDGYLKSVDWRDFQSGKIKAADVPRLRSTYVLNANDVSRRRISLAGKRLAELLKRSF